MTEKKLELRDYCVGQASPSAAPTLPKAARTANDRSELLASLYLATKLPWTLVMEFARMGGSVLEVGLVLELQRNLDRALAFAPRRYLMDSVGVQIGAETRALRKLENAGLVRVVRRSGRRPVTTLLWNARGSRKGARR